MEQKPKLKINWGYVALAALLGAVALRATVVDVMNNYQYGEKADHNMATVMALAAIGLSVLPLVAAIKQRWDWLVLAPTCVCGVLTFYAAVNAYMASHGEAILAAESATRKYEDARRAIQTAEADLKSAQAEAVAIGELMGSAELQAIYDKAARDIQSESKPENGGCSLKKTSRCQEAKTLASVTLPRVAAAKAKENALQRVNEVRARLNVADDKAAVGPKETGQAAKVIAAKMGWDAKAFEQSSDMSVTLLSILCTILLALLIHPATHFAMDAFSLEQPKAVRGPYKAKQARTAEPSPTPDTVIKGLPGFMAQCAPGEFIPQPKVVEALENWWRATKQSGAVPSNRALGLALGKGNFDKVTDRQKRVSYAIKLPAAAPRLVMAA